MIEELLGHTLVSVSGAKQYSDCITFESSDGTKWEMVHYQSCCENVSVEDICGDIDDLIGSPIVLAEEVTSAKDDGYWTFYKIGTNKGSVTIRWCGNTDSCYSLDVNFERV